jgi:peptidoglycan/xylan/chitin deacetylase (PgdA/CDA1 family)
MIHDIRQEYFNLPLNDYRLTFDDGLYAHYYYYPLFKTNPAELVFFIITSFIKPGKVRKMFDGEYLDYQKSKKVMYAAFIKGQLTHFMTLEELQILASHPNVRIGAHSHYHDVILTRRHPKKKKPLSPWKLERFQKNPAIESENLSIRSRLAFQGYYFRNGRLVQRTDTQWLDFIKYDTDMCISWFESNLGFTPDTYCVPFNEHNDQLLTVLKSFGFKTFYSARPKGNEAIRGRIDIDRLVEA